MSILDDLITAVFSPARKLGPYSSPVGGIAPLQPFTAQVTIREVHTDELVITEHPVEQGAAITDHAYKKPAELLLSLAWSNSGLQSALAAVQGLVSIFEGQGGDFNYMNTMYNKLLALQQARIPFDVTTGKRKYRNMLIRTLSVPTEDKSEHALFVTMVLKEVIIVQTQQISSTPAIVQANPQSNGPVTNFGTRQLTLTDLAFSPGLNLNNIHTISDVFAP